MEIYPSTWSTIGHAPKMPEAENDTFAMLDHSQRHHSSIDESEWSGFFRTLHQENSTAGAQQFDLSNFDASTQTPPHGVDTTSSAEQHMTGFPPATSALPEAATASNTPPAASSSYSSDGSGILFPHYQPESMQLNGAATSAPLMTYPPNAFNIVEPCHAEQTMFQPQPNDQVGLGIDCGPEQMHNLSHVSSYEQMYPGTPQTHHLNGQEMYWGRSEQSVGFQDEGTVNDDDNVDVTDPCYAQLLHQCLREAPDHTLALKDLYEWVSEHSQKAKDPKQNGWKNSVRHNLSMNAAFERVSTSNPAGTTKASGSWRLTPQALRDGVISTTRYRKDPKKKPERRGLPALKRQLSGARGGQATRAATRRNRELQNARSIPYAPAPRRYHPAALLNGSPLSAYSTHHASPAPAHAPIGPPPFFQHAHAHAQGPPPSPYYFDQLDASVSNPVHTPPQLQLSYDAPVKNGGPGMEDFDFFGGDFSAAGLFGGQEGLEGLPDTPSLGTEASFVTDEGVLGGM